MAISSELSKLRNPDTLIQLSLTDSQYAKLLDVLYQYNDGPEGEDCASSELEELRLLVEAASLQDASNA